MLTKFLQSLSDRPSSSIVYNQYKSKHAINNLHVFFEIMLEHHHDVLLIGEAPGYRGCRLTGIPFTSGTVIQNSQHQIFNQIRNKIMLPKLETEPTATVFWEFFGTDRTVPILWNAFPFHPHLLGNPESNRKPKHSEIDEGKNYLIMLNDIFRPKKLCSLGRVGQSILSELFPKSNIIYIRHPSHGGKKKFINGMSKLY